MVDQPNNFNNDDNRPRLKKVKRPIKKIVGQGQGNVNASIPPKVSMPSPAQNNNNRPENNQFNAPIKSENVDTFNIDSYLDNEEDSFNHNSSQFITEEDFADSSTRNPTKSKFMVGGLFTKNAIIAVFVGALFFGMILAKIFSSGEKVVQDGLQGVVINPEVPRGRARCGVAERTQGCVLYIMNPQRQELNARDFYDLAAQLTGRQKFVIETGNVRYSNVKIRPGAIAQFNIPPLIN